MDKWAVVDLVSRGVPRRKIINQVQVSGYLREGAVLPGMDKKSIQYGGGGVKMVTLWDEDYPQMLAEIPDPPVVLFCEGETPVLGRKLVAVVGSRKIGPRGRLAVARFVPALVKAGLGIVSGLAYGTDTLVHRTCLDCGGLAVAVLPTALDKIYPRENLALAAEIVRGGGCLLSEYPLGSVTLKKNFLERNRIVSGLARGVLVIEAAARSGSISTPNFALDQGREVWCAAAAPGEPNSEGILALIEDGAKAVFTTSDLAV